MDRFVILGFLDFGVIDLISICIRLFGLQIFSCIGWFMRFFVVGCQEIGGMKTKSGMLISYSSLKLLSDSEFSFIFLAIS